MKVVSGKLTGGMELVNERESKSEKLGKLMSLRGNKQEDMDAAEAGDIVAVAKLQSVQTGDTLCAKGSDISYDPIDFPSPILYQAIEAADKKQEDKVFAGLARLREEDPSFVIERNSETRQTLLGGQGEQQLNIIKDKLKDRFGVEVVTIPQKIAYRETIRGTSDVQGKHKKQTGGAGQYGDVHIKFSPCEAEFEFEETLFGGSIPKNYVPAIEKGLVESLERGPLAGCKVQGIHANLYDGSYHDVDSNEMAFKIAASLAFKEGMKQASPIMLEPIGSLSVTIPDDKTGEIMGNLSTRRGKVLGMEPTPGETGMTTISAEVPMREMHDFTMYLRQVAKGMGEFTFTFLRYDPLPSNLLDEVVASVKAETGEE
jgi:elongation factor G